MSQFFSEQALDPEFTLAFCFSERGPKELRGRSAMYLGALSDEQAAERGPVVKAERPWQRPSGAACANGAVDLEHGLEIENGFFWSSLPDVVLARLFSFHVFPGLWGFDSKTVQRSALCRSRGELSNEYLLAKFGFDTAENEP